MINDFVWPELYYIDPDNDCFQQDRTTCHTSNEIQKKIADRVISRRGDHNSSIQKASIQKLKVGYRGPMAATLRLGSGNFMQRKAWYWWSFVIFL